MNHDTFIDPRDGSEYPSVCIGRQCWMAANLMFLPSVYPGITTPDGSPRHYVYDYQGWHGDEAKACANYRHYGVLYNWPAALAACPPGWHLPDDVEWSELVDFLIHHEGLKPATVAYALKARDDPDEESERPGWRRSTSGYEARGLLSRIRSVIRRTLDRTPEGDHTDRFGFAALPGGRCTYGGFYRLGELGYWWSRTEASSFRAWCRQMTPAGFVNRWDMNKEYGYSVRCIRD